MKKYTTYGAGLILLIGLQVSMKAAEADERPTTNPAGYTEGTEKPAKVNRASTLVGMEVRNQNDEKLGEIQEVVIDLRSGKVSYAVLDAGGLFSDKLFAIPMTAFSAGADDDFVVLNADKTKMETAQGFSKDQWPAVANPQWGADKFWQDSPNSTDVNRTDRIDPDHDRNSDRPGANPNPANTTPRDTAPNRPPQDTTPRG